MKILKKLKLKRIIQNSVNLYTEGIIFTNDSGVPILVNKKMNSLIDAILNKYVIETKFLWDELSAFEHNECCKKLEVFEIESYYKDYNNEHLYFRFSDGKIWEFSRIILKSGKIFEFLAYEITEIYNESLDLFRENQKLNELLVRQNEYLKNVEELNKEKELLALKMNIHDELGECIITSKNYIKGNLNYNKNSEDILAMWKTSLNKLVCYSNDTQKISKWDELLKSAELIGCKIKFNGDFVNDTIAGYILYSATREGLINAVKHSKANEIIVTTRISDDMYSFIIENNGKSEITEIKENGGLKNLLKLIESKGGTLDYKFGNNVTLLINLPKSKNDKYIDC